MIGFVNPNIKLTLAMCVFILSLNAISFLSFSIYKSLWKYIGPMEAIRITISVGTATMIAIAMSIMIGIPSYYVSMIFTTGLLTTLLMFVVRSAYRLKRRNVLSSKKEKNAIIIGAGDGGYVLLKEITQNQKFENNIVGFIDDQKYNKIVSGYKVLGSTYDLPKIVDKYKIETAFIAIPSASKSEIVRISDLCSSLNLNVKIMKQSDSFIGDAKEKEQFPVENISIEDLLGRGEIKLDQHEISNYLTNKTIAITGAGGSIGSELCRQISKFKPLKIVMIDMNENYLYMLEQELNRNLQNRDEHIEIISYIASIREFNEIDEIFASIKPDVVYHAAAHKHVPLMETRPQEAIKNNVFGTNNVITACIKNKIPRFIMISTDKSVNPTNVMGATKRMTEMILQANGNNGVTKMAAVRFGNVLGSNGSVIPIFKKQIEEGGPITITDKNIIRYFMTIPEAAQLVLQAGYYADKGEIFVLDMGEPVKILDLAEKMIRLIGLKPYEDIDIVEIGLRPGEKMFEELILDGESSAKTKNNLIFKTNIMDINKSDVDNKLNLLQKSLDERASGKELKKLILEVIKD